MPRKRNGWRAVRELWDGSKKKRWEGRVRNVHRTKIDGLLLCTATAAEGAGTNVLTEVLDLISTEQMTWLTAFTSIDRIVQDAKTKINERWTKVKAQWCGSCSSAHPLEVTVAYSVFWEDRFSRPKFS